MSDTRITINGQHYDSPDTMPPDVRRTYEEALRSLGSALESDPSDEGLPVLTQHSAPLGGDLVVSRAVTADNRKYGSVDELPPEVRKLYQDALRGATSPIHKPETSVRLTVNISGDSGESHARGPQPTSELESTIRGMPEVLGITIVIVLILWYILAR